MSKHKGFCKGFMKKVPGGMAENVDPALLDKTQWRMGKKVEMEHTNDPSVAKEIAADHLAEEILKGKKQSYYSKLKKMESE
jgi:uncharacterized protein YhfF